MDVFSHCVMSDESSNASDPSDTYNTCLGYFPISSSGPRPLEAAYIPILLSEVEQEQRPSGNGDREAIVVGAGLCDGECERAYIVMPHILFSLSEHILDHKGVRPKYFR